MDLIAHLYTGVLTVFTLQGISMLVLGVLLGIIIGALPGMSPAMGVALLVPLTYGMDPAPAFILFVAAYQAANYGGSITAIAVNAPGTPSSAVTAIDGFALTKKGEADRALGAAVLSSSIGGFFGALILILFAVPVASFALLFGPAEYCMLAIFGLSTVIAFQANNWLKGASGILLGLLLATMQADPFTGDPRFSLGLDELYDGISFVPALIGLFACGEVFHQLLYPGKVTASPIRKAGGALASLDSMIRYKGALIRSSLIGTFIGVIPGAGATIASFIAYGQGKKYSKEKETFGNGSEEGIISSEAANSSSVGGALVPLLSLGIPGSATDAVLLGALTLHGLVAGPELFARKPDLVYGIFVSLLLANVLILFFGAKGNRIWLSIIRIPQQRLLPLILALCFLGSYASRSNVFDMGVCLAFGILGCLLKARGYQPASVVLGLVLGRMIEINYRRTLLMGDHDLFLTRPISLCFLLLTVASLLVPIVATFRKTD